MRKTYSTTKRTNKNRKEREEAMFMTEEDISQRLRKLNEYKKEREKQYIEAKGILQGMRLTRLNPQQEGLVKLLEFLNDSFRATEEKIISLEEGQLMIIDRISKLEKETKQLRKTLDIFHENK
jgi:hypothetical protein